MNYFNLAIFFPFSFKDAIDILLVSILFYQLYKILKGTVAINIFIGITAVYLIGLIVEALQMKLLGTIIRQFIGVGGIALVVLFQQEIRKFLIVIGLKSWNSTQLQTLRKWFPFTKKNSFAEFDYSTVVTAVYDMAKTKTGAIIVITNQNDLSFYANTGDKINAKLSCRLLESIFCKNSPLHDGAVIISGEKIVAARCVLPVSDDEQIDARYGMRHRASLGISEVSDSFTIIVSEETGEVGYAKNGKLKHNIQKEDLIKLIQRDAKK